MATMTTTETWTKTLTKTEANNYEDQDHCLRPKTTIAKTTLHLNYVISRMQSRSPLAFTYLQ